MPLTKAEKQKNRTLLERKSCRLKRLARNQRYASAGTYDFPTTTTNNTAHLHSSLPIFTLRCPSSLFAAHLHSSLPIFTLRCPSSLFTLHLQWKYWGCLRFSVGGWGDKTSCMRFSEFYKFLSCNIFLTIVMEEMGQTQVTNKQNAFRNLTLVIYSHSHKDNWNHFICLVP
jgi:hypothetical protein